MRGGLYGCDERRLREAKASGDAILARARQLKGLAKANRRRGEARAKERDWTAANSRLEVEREAAERELLATMREMADRRSHQEVHFALEDWRAMCAHARRGARGTWEKAVNLKLSKDAVCYAVKTRDRETAEAIKVFAADLGHVKGEFDLLNEKLEAACDAMRADLVRSRNFASGRRHPEGARTAGALVAGYPLAPDAVRRVVEGSFARLEFEFEMGLKGWADHSDRLEGGFPRLWPAERHESLVTARAEGMRLVGSKGREAVLKHLAMMVPACSDAEIRNFDDWYLQRKALLERRRNLEKKHRRERGELATDSEELLQRATTEVMEAGAAAMDKLKVESKKERLKKKLREMGAQKAVDAEVREFLENLERQRQAKARAASDAKKEHRAEQNKQLIEEYRTRIAARKAEEERLRALEEQEMQRELAVLQEYNAARTKFRRRQEELKRELAVCAKEEQEMLEAEREARLAAIRAEVAPYVEDDPARVFKDTDAFAHQKQAVEDEKLFKPMNGFSDDKLFKDPRFKLSEALRAANLHESAAARAAIARALPSNAPRVDTFTTGQVGFPYR